MEPHVISSKDATRRYAFDVHEPISRALMGNVLRGVALESNEPVAVKRLKRTCVDMRVLADGRTLLGGVNENPRGEAATLALLQEEGGHAGVVRLLDAIEDDAFVYLVFEMAEGGDLFSVTHEAQSRRIQEGGSILSRAALPESAVKKITKQLISALRFVHARGFAHRDVSLENILRMKRDAWVVKLTDFGLAAPLEKDRWVTRDGDVDSRVGKAHYAAPEAWSGASLCPYDGRAADAWSVGACVLTMLLGQHAWSAPCAKEAVIQFLARSECGRMCAYLEQYPYVSPSAADFLDGLLRCDPAKRVSLREAEMHPWLQDIA
jgi:calcium-dependent protein kinase